MKHPAANDPKRWVQKSLSFRLRLWTLAGVIMLTACGRYAVSDRIGAQARQTGEVDLAKAAAFAWTEVRIYTPYSVQQAICNDLGDLAPRCAHEVPSGVPEAEFLLVFINEGKVARYEPHLRSNGNFMARSGVLAVQRSAALFDVAPHRASRQGSAIYLEPRHLHQR